MFTLAFPLRLSVAAPTVCCRPIPVRGFICRSRQFYGLSSASTGDARRESSVMAAVDMQARVASLEQELATVRAQADSDAINAEHQSQAMEARYNALEAEHSEVRDGSALAVPKFRTLRRVFVRVNASTRYTRDTQSMRRDGSTIQRRMHRARPRQSREN